MQPRSPRAVLERRLAVLFAALTLLVWPAAVWHRATTVHEVCAEHGELVDVASAGPAAGEHAGTRADSDGEHEREHEHCPFVSLAQPTTAAPEARDAGAVRVEAALPPHRGSETALATIPLLLRAPKTSPPA